MILLLRSHHTEFAREAEGVLEEEKKSREDGKGK